MATAANAATYQCPNCNGVLAFNAATGYLECNSCGAVFEEDQAAHGIPVGARPIEAQEAQHVKTVDEFLDNAPWAIEAEGSAAAQTTVRYSCPSCGAGIVADQSTVSTSCPYCGNNMFVAGIATADTIPQWILPFTITRTQAQACMQNHFLHKWYLSRKFSAQLEHIQPVYVPYHLYDISVTGRADYIAYNEVSSKGHSTKYYYAFKRAGHASFQKIPIDGSSKMPDGHMDAIAPFDFQHMRNFSAGYAAGYLMEVADESIEKCQPRAEARARKSFEDDLKADVLKAKSIDGIDSVVSHKTNVHVDNASSCVLPVWLMHCTWNDEQMLFAVNGETGKCVGDLPIDKKRRWTTVGILVLIFALITIWAGIDISSSHSDDGWQVVTGLGIATALVPLLVDGYFKSQMRTAVEAENAEMSYTDQGLVITERWQTEKSYLRKSKALDKLKEMNTTQLP